MAGKLKIGVDQDKCQATRVRAEKENSPKKLFKSRTNSATRTRSARLGAGGPGRQGWLAQTNCPEIAIAVTENNPAPESICPFLNLTNKQKGIILMSDTVSVMPNIPRLRTGPRFRPTIRSGRKIPFPIWGRTAQRKCPVVHTKRFLGC